MKFSVLVPVYNARAYLEDCANSILCQSHADLELVLVDDGSTDGSGELCDAVAARDGRVKVIHKPNGGVTSARKAAAAAATGDYIVCVDADDHIAQGYLAEFDKYAERGADVVCGGFIAEEGERETAKTLPYAPGEYNRARIERELFPSLIEDECGRGFAPALWAKAFRAELFKDIQARVDDDIRIGEDGVVTRLCVYRAGLLYITDVCGYYYRKNVGSATGGRAVRSMDEAKKIAMLYEDVLDNENADLMLQVSRDACHRLFNICASQYNRSERGSVIAADIKGALKDEYYSAHIRRAAFRPLSHRLMRLALRRRWLFLIKKYHKKNMAK